MNKLPALPLLLVVVFLFSACSIVEQVKPETPRQSIALAYITIDSLADSVRIAKRDELISAQRRDKLVDELQTALDNVTRAEESLKLFEISGDTADQTEFELRLQQAETILTIVEFILQESNQ